MRQLSPELAEIARRDLNEIPERLEQDLIILREWIRQQRHLRARTNDEFLIAFLRRCKFSLEATKKRLENFFSYYNVFPEVLRNRYINSRMFHINKLGVHYYPEFPKCNNNTAILIARFGQFDPNLYNIKEIFQFIMMAMEMIALENDHATVAGVCQILDLKDVSFERLRNFDRCMFQRYWYWVMQCCPLRMKEVYVVNADKEMQRRFNFMKAFTKSPMCYPVYIIKSFEDLYNYIPKCNLPEEYGGTNGHIAECTAYMEDLLQDYRHYFNEDALYGCSEELRDDEVEVYEAEFGLNGSFRKLIVD